MKGFYSPIDQLAAQLPRTKGTGAEFMTELSKRPGYKPQEAQDRELQTLMALPKMERAQFLAQLKSKPVPKLDETVLTDSDNTYDDDNNAKYGEYTLPGGNNYREILLRMPHDPNRRANPASGHWDHANVLAHVRAKDRMIPGKEGYTLVNKKSFNKSQHFDTAEEAQAALQSMPESLRPSLDIRPSVGPKRKVLHIEEIQSDWHQKGRDKGYLPSDMPKQMAAAKLAHRRLKEQLEEARGYSEGIDKKLSGDKPLYQDPEVRQRMEAAKIEHNNSIMDLMPQVMKAEAAYQDLEHKAKTGVPDAPFKKNWHELALKKMIHHAAANGYDSIAITPGAEQAKRYSLAKHINGLQYDPQSKHLIAAGDKGEVINKMVEPHELPSYIGKEVTEKLLGTLPLQGRHHLTGINLETGGEGMKGFYDKMVPAFLNQFGKKYGAQVGKTPLYVEGEIEPGDVTFSAPRTVPLHHFPITPEMREDVTKNGVPLYAEGGEVKVRPTVKDETIQRKIPEIEAAAKALQAGAIKRSEYDKVVNKHKPVKPYTFVPQPATDKDADRALMANKKPHWRGHEQWPAGRKVGLRLDIPAYEGHGVWVNSIHDEEGSGEDKYPTAYNSVSSVKNATFDAKPEKAVRVATGEQNKSPFARIHGELHHMTEDEAVEHMKAHLNHPDYAQVGMDPRRHGFFYDRKTMKPVTHSAHVVQIGPLVLAHKPTYGKRESYATGGKVKPIGYTKEKVTVSPNLDAMRYELMSVKHYAKKVK